MPKLKLVLTIAIVLLVVGGIGSAITFKSVISAEEKTSTELINSTDVQNIELVSDNAGIEIIPTTEAEIKVEFTAKERKHDRYKVRTELSNQHLFIELKEKRIFQLLNVDFDFTVPKLKVYVPEQQYESLDVSNINGKIYVEKVSVVQLDAETVNGSIYITNTSTTSSKVESENGKITLQDVSGNIQGDVTNGSILLETDDLDRSIDLESVNGKISVQSANEPTNVTIDVSVVNGKVDIFGNDTRHAVIGDGENILKLSTVNGSVSVSN